MIEQIFGEIKIDFNSLNKSLDLRFSLSKFRLNRIENKAESIVPLRRPRLVAWPTLPLLLEISILANSFSQRRTCLT